MEGQILQEDTATEKFNFYTCLKIIGNKKIILNGCTGELPVTRSEQLYR